MAIESGSAPYLEQLHMQYPVGNSEIWPGRRIYKRMVAGKIFYWDLDAVRLRIWASALVR